MQASSRSRYDRAGRQNRTSARRLARRGLLADPALANGYGHSADYYRWVRTPPLDDTYSEQRLVRAARTLYRATPPRYTTVTRQVLVRPVSVEPATLPTVYANYSNCVRA